MYEVGASRRRNHMHTLMKNTMLIPLVTITFFFFGWWIYFAFPHGPWINDGKGIDFAAAEATAVRYKHGHQSSGSTLPVCSGQRSCCSPGPRPRSCRVPSSNASGPARFWILAVLIGSVCWIIDAAWGWHWDGWMVTFWAIMMPMRRALSTPSPAALHLVFCRSRAPARQVRRGRHAARYSTAQSLAGDHRAVPDLYRFLGLLCSLQRADHLARKRSAVRSPA